MCQISAANACFFIYIYILVGHILHSWEYELRWALKNNTVKPLPIKFLSAWYVGHKGLTVTMDTFFCIEIRTGLLAVWWREAGVAQASVSSPVLSYGWIGCVQLGGWGQGMSGSTTSGNAGSWCGPTPRDPHRRLCYCLNLDTTATSFTATPALTGTRTGGLLWGLAQEMGVGVLGVGDCVLCPIHTVRLSPLEVLITQQQIQTGDHHHPSPSLKPLFPAMALPPPTPAAYRRPCSQDLSFHWYPSFCPVHSFCLSAASHWVSYWDALPLLSLFLSASLRIQGHSVYDCWTEGGVQGENKCMQTGNEMCGFKMTCHIKI